MEFNTLYKRYRSMVRKVCFKYATNYHETQELEQESWAKIYEHLDKYNPNSEVQRSTWMHRIAENVCIDWVRKKEVRPVLVPESAEELYHEDGSWIENMLEDHDTPEDYAIADETALTDEELMHALSLQQYAIYTFIYTDGAEVPHVADFLGTTNAYVYKELSTIRRKIEKILQER